MVRPYAFWNSLTAAALCLASLTALADAPVNAASPVTPLYSFSALDSNQHNFDGAYPTELVRGSDGSFYGAAQGGGTAGTGTVFKVTPAGSVTILHEFGDGSIAHDGSNPHGKLIVGTDGNFYGTTTNGGVSGVGTAYKMTPAGTVTILHNFGDGTVTNDGSYPNTLVQGADGNFYGTAAAGGSAGKGTVFKMTPAGTVTILHSFGDGTVANDGAYPTQTLVRGPDGNFYSTTNDGGASAATDPYHLGFGMAYKMSPSGTVTILHSFGDGAVPNDGKYPNDLMLSADGNFYGTAGSGGSSSNAGAVFQMTPAGTVTILHKFNDGSLTNDGRNPFGVLAQTQDGTFYGSTINGGSTATSGEPYSGEGTVFSMTPAGAVTILHSFGDGTIPNESGFPSGALVLGTDGNFYGTANGGVEGAVGGSAAGNGSVFRLAVTAAAPVWSVRDVAAVSDGTSRMLWTRSDGAAGIWTINAAGISTAIGTVYGPYAGWSAKAVSMAGDGTSRLLWTNASGAAGIWTFDAAGRALTTGVTYGPFTAWTASDIATAPDGTSRLLWTNTSGAAGVWTLDAAGTSLSVGTTYGPFPGWTTQAVGAAGDGTARILWTRSDGAMGLWRLDASNQLQAVGTTYGPYAGWSATGLGTSANGASNVLWTRSDGAAGVWSFNASDAATLTGTVYGPFPGFRATALDASSDQARVLWTRSDRAAGIWSFASNDDASVIGSIYGPF